MIWLPSEDDACHTPAKYSWMYLKNLGVYSSHRYCKSHVIYTNVLANKAKCASWAVENSDVADFESSLGTELASSFQPLYSKGFNSFSGSVGTNTNEQYIFRTRGWETLDISFWHIVRMEPGQVHTDEESIFWRMKIAQNYLNQKKSGKSALDPTNTKHEMKFY